MDARERRPGRFATRRRVAALVLVLVVVGALGATRLPGLSGDGESESGAPLLPRTLRPVEAQWVTRASVYLASLAGARTAVSPGALRECEDELDSQLGEPPGRRLDDLHELVVTACRKLRRSAVDAERTADVQRETAEGERLLRLARAAVAPHAAPLAASSVHTLLSSVASQLVGREVTVRCWSPRAWRAIVERELVRTEFGALAGLAGFEQEAVQLAPRVCGSLERLEPARRGRVPRVDSALAVGVLSHQVVHLASDGPDNEAGVECHGMQRIAEAARLLGLAGADAERLAGVYLAVVYRRHRPRYRSPECRNGGKLDVRPKSDVWP